MGKIDTNIADKIIRHLIDISNDNLKIDEEDILAENDEGMQEILLGLRHLSEDLIYNKQNTEKATEEIKTKNALLLKQNEELEHFAYVVSHDLKAPLLGVHTLASFIEEDLASGDKTSVLSHLELMKTRIARMEKLIQGILEFSKIGMTQVKKERIDLNELAAETFDGLNAPDNFKFNILHELPEVYGVKSLFIQLFANLASNAIKFNNKSQGYLDIGYKSCAINHQFSFKDNGPGIDKKYQEKVFAVFQTLDSEPSSRNTGIGLSITKKIVTTLNGTIKLKSEKDKGAEFIIELPLDMV